jgi:hypothetical protein
MRETRKALVLTLASNPNPMLIEIDNEAEADLAPRLVHMVRNGHTQELRAANGSTFVVDFSHVVTAHVEDVSNSANLYGSVKRAHAG